MSLDDLSDTPLPTTTTQPFDPATTEFLAFLDDLCDRETAAFAWDTLAGIATAIRRAGVVSTAQRTAVENIYAGMIKAEARARKDLDELPSRRGVGSRRYEGYGR